MNTMAMRILQLAVLMGGMIVAGNNLTVRATSYCPECSEAQVPCCGTTCGICCSLFATCSTDYDAKSETDSCHCIIEDEPE